MNESDNKVGMPFAKQKLTLGVAALGLVGLVSWAGWTAFQGSSSPSVSPVASAFAAGDSSGQSDRQVASINGMKITEMELGGMLQSGVDRAIVIDRYINKVVAAERGREMYVEEAKAALRAAEREVLSTLYTTKRMDELRKAVSDDDVKAYYDANVLDQNFQQQDQYIHKAHMFHRQLLRLRHSSRLMDLYNQNQEALCNYNRN